jgi:hypothetical protein
MSEAKRNRLSMTENEWKEWKDTRKAVAAKLRPRKKVDAFLRGAISPRGQSLARSPYLSSVTSTRPRRSHMLLVELLANLEAPDF